MNKELIKKYKKEFDYWLNGGELLSKHPDENDWYNVTTVLWNNPNIQYIINDKFVEFRKALAEGKQLQYNFGNFGPNKQDFPNFWKDLDLSIGIISSRAFPENYRIKQEQTIKVGDWLFDLQYKTYYRVNNVLSDKVELNGFNVLLSAVNGYDYMLWKPKIGEWCIIDDPKVSDIDYSFTVQKWGLTSTWTLIPYTGPIPYFIKD